MAKALGVRKYPCKPLNRLLIPMVCLALIALKLLTLRLILDLPQLHVVSYNSKSNYLHFDYLPDDDRLRKLNSDQLCLNIRQSTDGNLYQPIDQCLAISNNRVHWLIRREHPYLKLAICSKKNRQICGQEIEMKEGFLLEKDVASQSSLFR